MIFIQRRKMLLRFKLNFCLFIRYNQALAMTRFYKRPILLIEFDQTKPFSLQVMRLFDYFFIPDSSPFLSFTKFFDSTGYGCR